MVLIASGYSSYPGARYASAPIQALPIPRLKVAMESQWDRYVDDALLQDNLVCSVWTVWCTSPCSRPSTAVLDHRRLMCTKYHIVGR